jgi:hypothetical protein
MTPRAPSRRVIPGDDPAPPALPLADEGRVGTATAPGVMGVPSPVAAGPAPAPDGRGPGPGAVGGRRAGAPALQARYAPMRIGWFARAVPLAS